MAESLLIIEDEPVLGAELARYFERQGWDVSLSQSIGAAKDLLQKSVLEPFVVLSDMSLPDGNALDLLQALREQRATNAEWVFLTGYGTIADSVRGLRLGAYDFLEKPCDMQRLDIVVGGAARSARAQRRLSEQGERQNRRYSIEAFVGDSAQARFVRETLAKLASVPLSTVLLSGETGTGKGLAARILHYNGARATGPLVEINCAALPRELLESELFGHEAGAFTGAKARRRGLLEQAHGGSLFLDEIGELPLELQAKLLKVIEDRRFRRLGGASEVSIDVQLTAASNLDLRQQAEQNRFRPDLYHRLAVFTLELPPLRGRIADLNQLVPAFIAEFNAIAHKDVRLVPDAVWQRLLAYSWPGNVRELRNVIERCVLLSEGETMPSQWLHLEQRADATSVEIPALIGSRLCLPLDGSMSLDAMDREIIKAALDHCESNATAAARLLGSTRETLRYRIQKHGLKSTDIE